MINVTRSDAWKLILIAELLTVVSQSLKPLFRLVCIYNAYDIHRGVVYAGLDIWQ